MRTTAKIFIGILVIAGGVVALFYLIAPRIQTNKEVAQAVPMPEAEGVGVIPRGVIALPTNIHMDVPYINEAPDGNWTGPWKNACEEAAIVMVERFYKGEKQVSVADARRSLQHLFNVQNTQWGSNANSDAARTVEIVKLVHLFQARVVTHPALDDIKKELAAGRPVISLHKGFDLGNKNIPFLPTGSSYHTLVLIGYDDATGEFITHDDGDAKEGAGRRYAYTTVMNSLHDYNYKTNLTDGPPTVIFTSAK